MRLLGLGLCLQGIDFLLQTFELLNTHQMNQESSQDTILEAGVWRTRGSVEDEGDEEKADSDPYCGCGDKESLMVALFADEHEG